MNKVSVSVIIPIYNAEKYLVQCIESVVNQTLRDIEIILINDGSKDSSADICEKYVKTDSRIKYIYKENEGLAAARQDGIEMASGEYVGFVDSDDWVEEDMYEKLYSYGVNNNAEVVLCNSFEYSEKKNFIELNTGFYNREKIVQEILPRTIIGINEKGSRSNIRWSNCLRIYKKSTLDENNIKFDRRFRRSQDLAFTYDVMLYAKGFYFTDEFFYHNRQDGGSLSRGYTKDMWILIKPLIDHIHHATLIYGNPEMLKLSSSTAFFLMVDCILNEFKIDGPGVYEKIKHIKDILVDPICKETIQKIEWDKLNKFYYKVFYRNMKANNASKLVMTYYYYTSDVKKRIIIPLIHVLTENVIYKKIILSFRGK